MGPTRAVHKTIHGPLMKADKTESMNHRRGVKFQMGISTEPL